MDERLNILNTARLHLRKLRTSDASLIQALNSNAEVMHYIGPVERDLAKAQAYVDLRVAQYADRPGLGIFVAELAQGASENSEYKKETIGWFCLKNLDDTDEIEVGYRLLPQFWNKGYATEGAKALVDHGFNRLGLTEIVGVVLPTNLASKAVLQKTGLSYVGLKTYYGHELDYFMRQKTAESV